MVFGVIGGVIITIALAVPLSHAQTETSHQLDSDTTATTYHYTGRLGLAASLDVRVGWHEPGYVANRLEAGGWDHRLRDSGIGFGIGVGCQVSKNILWLQGNYYNLEYSLSDRHDLGQDMLSLEVWLRRTIDPFPGHKWFKVVPGIGWGRCRYEVNYEYQDPKLKRSDENGDGSQLPDPVRTGTLLRSTDNVFSAGILFEFRSKEKKNTLLLFSVGYEYWVATFSNAEAVTPSEEDFPYTFPMLGLFKGQTPDVRFSGHYLTFSVGGIWWAVK
jgi:hypothetical protein